MGKTEEITACIPRLRRYARALTGNRDSADDLVQDTLERAWSRFHLWRHGSDLRAWLFTIMHNLFINHTRRRNRESEIPPEDKVSGIPLNPPLDALVELKQLDKALRHLPDEQREVVLLVGLEQMSYHEVARVLGIPVGTVMSRLSRGRERLRNLIDGKVGGSQLKVVK
ncbi:MAG: RNA polymerase sigma factor [Deltaproteobacteria bacterium]|nr:RNA polymerase sigma factor [Deltaproteobacteria bacterium]